MVTIHEEKGLTQSQLAEICNVKQPVIAEIESSVHSPQTDSFYLAAVLPADSCFVWDCSAL